MLIHKEQSTVLNRGPHCSTLLQKPGRSCIIFLFPALGVACDLFQALIVSVLGLGDIHTYLVNETASDSLIYICSSKRAAVLVG